MLILNFYKIGLFQILLIMIVMILSDPSKLYAINSASRDISLNNHTMEDLPYYDSVMEVINPLEYSGLYAVIKPNVTLSIDFDRRKWTLHNIREYNAQGTVALEKGRLGLCAELSAYVYEKLKSIFSDQYDIQFAKVRERGFFVQDLSNHVVLVIRDKITRAQFLIDPSFHKYGRISALPDYKILGVKDTLSFLKEESHDFSFLVDQAMPLYIKDDFLLSFSIESVDGKFDTGNFFFSVSADHRYNGTGPVLILFGKRDGQIKNYERGILLKQLMKPDEIEALYKKMNIWLNQMDLQR